MPHPHPLLRRAWLSILASVLGSVSCPGLAERAPTPAVAAPILYQIDLRQPAAHLISVTMTISEARPATRIQFPAWNALYQMRDFVRNVQNLSATCDGKAVRLRPLDLETWESAGELCHALEIRYRVYADQESPFSCTLNEQHAFINFAQILFYLPAERARSDRVRVRVLEGWRVATLLDAAGSPDSYQAPNYDVLADSPLEAGTFAEYDYRQGGAVYRAVVDVPAAVPDPKRLVKSLEKITSTETALMQDVPFARYTFIFHFFTEGGGGGMEHANGCVIGFPAARLRSDWEGLESLVAHEFFHLWNVKRIRPAGLEPVDYVRGNDTRDLWFSEGVTSTYEELTLVRAGMIHRQTFYRHLAAAIQALKERPARRFESLELAGLEAWLEKYPDYFRPERSISYYNKGELVGFLLDLGIRQASGNRHSLDDLLRALDEQFAGRGRFFTDDDLRVLIGNLAGPAMPVDAFFRDYITGTRELDYATYLGYAGLSLSTATQQVPDWGFVAVRRFEGPIVVASVPSGSPAVSAGLEPGDTLVGVDGETLTVLPQDLTGVESGQEVTLGVRRRSRNLTLNLTLGSKTQTTYRVDENPDATPDEVRLRDGWLSGKTE